MAENADSIELGRTDQELTRGLIAHLSQELNLRFRHGYGNDPTVAHSYLENADDVFIAIFGVITEGEFVIELTWTGPRPSDTFIGEFRRKVTRALASLPI